VGVKKVQNKPTFGNESKSLPSVGESSGSLSWASRGLYDPIHDQNEDRSTIVLDWQGSGYGSMTLGWVRVT